MQKKKITHHKCSLEASLQGFHLNLENKQEICKS